MGVQAAAGGGGAFVFREYFGIEGTLRRALIAPGIVILGRLALRNLGKPIGGTSAEFRRTGRAVPGSARESPPRGERVEGRASRTAPSIKSLLCPERAKDWPLYGRYEGRLSYH
jgi:hypothetical protein